jgi:hypothetical protein
MFSALDLSGGALDIRLSNATLSFAAGARVRDRAGLTSTRRRR